ncbi:uncharacterized protein LOC142330983 [Lycorma delicatula]|uniref:uncharacterized protein LOC142330983 n=1 Tax=Lycorma delicatula TaxID=130591 RepID=UPI003F518BC1
MCISTASLLPLDTASASVKQEVNGENFSYSIHEARGLHLPAPTHGGQIGILAPKTIPIDAINSMNPVNFVHPAASGLAAPVAYSHGAHPIIHAPHLGLPQGAPVPYIGYTYPVIEMPKELKA